MSFKDKIDEILASAVRSQLNEKKKMDPVGKADADIDNDGDVDSSDEYLHNRRKAIAKAMKKEEASDEPITAKDIKMAIGIANDARYKDGNYTAAYNKIASMKKGLVSHPRVKDALRRANEALDLKDKQEGSCGTTNSSYMNASYLKAAAKASKKK